MPGFSSQWLGPLRQWFTRTTVRGMKEVWLKQPNGPWVERFWPNPGLEQDRGARPVAVDLGRHLLLHEPPLLKRRRQLTLSQARELWRNRVKAGWQRCEPQW